MTLPDLDLWRSLRRAASGKLSEAMWERVTACYSRLLLTGSCNLVLSFIIIHILSP